MKSSPPLSAIIQALHARPSGITTSSGIRNYGLEPISSVRILLFLLLMKWHLYEYSKDQDNVLSIVLSTVYATGWVGMGFSKDGMMVGSSAMVGWMGKTGIPHIKPYYLGGKSSSEVKLNQGQFLATAVRRTVVVEQAKIYIAFQLKFSAPVTQQKLLFAFGMKIPVNKRLTRHDDRTSISFDFSSGLVILPIFLSIFLADEPLRCCNVYYMTY
ncbi:putative cytochrome b561 and DOMON domain-containing protein [Cocos nucifera]|nr:putative cytochrome b561 and DOMON domain-containing protein [Cocos nucifera]